MKIFHVEKTSLFDFHNQMNAKMVSFGGYYLPINYAGGIISEHIHTRSKASITACIQVCGPAYFFFVMEAMEACRHQIRFRC